LRKFILPIPSRLQVRQSSRSYNTYLHMHCMGRWLATSGTVHLSSDGRLVRVNEGAGHGGCSRRKL
jgi:hypothetical protein